MGSLWSHPLQLGQTKILGGEARQLTSDERSAAPMPSGSADLVLTSPPYGGAQKYIRASSLSLGWLNLCGSATLGQLERSSIGREHFRKTETSELPDTGDRRANNRLKEVSRSDPVRAALFANYLAEMGLALSEAWRVLKDGGHLVLITGDNHLKGKPFPTSHLLRQFASDRGFQTRLILRDRIRSRGLLTKRHSAASIIPEEHITVLRKPA